MGVSILAGHCSTVRKKACLLDKSPRDSGWIPFRWPSKEAAPNSWQGVMMWQPYTRSNGQWIATKILQGFFGAPMESLAEVSVSDVVRFKLDSLERNNIDQMTVLHPRAWALHGSLRTGFGIQQRNRTTYNGIYQ